MTSISLSLLATYAAYARARFVRKTQQVIATQDQFLCNLLQLHRETELGQQFGLREIKTIDQFRSRIPILPYDSYETYVNRIAAGEKNVLNPDPAVYINFTSGSNGNKKQVSKSVSNKFYLSLNVFFSYYLDFSLANYNLECHYN